MIEPRLPRRHRIPGARTSLRTHRSALGQFLRFGCTSIWVGLLATAPVKASEVSTNVDLVVATARQAVRDGLADLDSDGQELSWRGPLLLLPQEDAEENWVVEHLLLEELLSRGFEVTLDSTAVGSDGAYLSYRSVDLSVSGSSGLLGGRVERRCRLTLALRLTSGGEVRWQTEAKSEIADRVPKSRIEVLQSSNYDFAATELEEKNWGKFVEPIIVSAVLGSLVYIFFTNR